MAPGLRLPDTVTPLAYDLRLDVDPASELFSGEVAIEVRIDKRTDHVWLHADELEITRASWSHGPLTRDIAGEQMIAFRFGRTVEPGTITLRFAFTGKTTGEEEGLFRQRDGAWYVYSQGEAVFARRITPCFDEPRFRTPWRVSLVVPKQLVALSNMPDVATTVQGAKKEVLFAATPPMPSYLLAVAVGPFEIVEVGAIGRARVPTRVVVPNGKSARAAVAGLKLPATVDALESYIDDSLPYPKLDLVAVPEFFGAMENPGLITFHQQILLGDAKRPSFVSYFTMIAAHEIAHQWFGNLVSPQWWDHLWLSEAFASWLGDRIVRELGAYDDAPLRGALARREAIEADRFSGGRPLRRVVTTTAEADEGFDSIAYSKGQVVLGTFEAFVGAERFRDAMRAYVREMRGRNATTDDMVSVLSRVTTPQLGRALKHYVLLSSTPVVELALQCDDKPVITARAVGGVPIPLCIRFGTGRVLSRTCALVEGTVVLPVGPTCPTSIHANPDAGYYHTRWLTNGPRGPAVRVADLDPGARIVTGDDLAAAVFRGELAATDAIAEIRLLTDGNDIHGRLGAVALARAIDPLVDDATRPAWTRFVVSRFGDALAYDMTVAGKPGVDELVQALLGFVPADRFTKASRAFANLDRRLANAFGPLPAWIAALAAVDGGDKLFDRILMRARILREPDARESWLAALGEFGAAQLPKAVVLVTTGDLDPVAAWPAVARYLARSATRTAAWRAVHAELATIVRRMGGEAGKVVDAMGHLCDQKSRDEVVTALSPHVASIDAGARRLARVVASIDACIARRAALGDVAAAL